MAKPKVGDTVGGFKFLGGDPKDKAAWQPASGTLNVGDIVNGHTFVGGNPKDKNNWQEVAPEIAQEQHPEFGMMDRLAVKNFSNSPESSIAYLQDKHPGMEINQYKGQIIGKMPGEKGYKVLDPDTGMHPIDHPGEFLKDAGDVAYDMASGIPVQALTALGGALGFATPIPGATMGGAMVAGAGANAGNEYIRQKIGQLIGVNKDVNTDDVKFAAKMGVASPLLFGVDKAPMVKSLAKEGFEDAARGLLNSGAVKTVSLATGIPAETIRQGFKRLPAIKMFEKDGVDDFVTATHDDINTSIHEAKSQVGSQIHDVIERAGGKVDLTVAKAKIQKLIDEYSAKAKELGTPEMAEKLNEVQQTFKSVFGENTPAKVAKIETGILDEFGKPITKEIVEKPAGKELSQVSAKGAFELQQQLADLAEMHKGSPGILSRFSRQSQADKRLGNAATDSYKAVAESLEKTIKTVGDETNTLGELKGKYKELSRLQRDIAPRFSSPEKTYNTMRTMSGKNKQFFFEKVKQMDAKLGTDVADKAKDLEVFSLFSKAPTDAISSQGVTSTSRTAPMAIAGGTLGYGAAGFPGGAVGTFLGSKAASPAAVRMGMELLNPLVKGSKLVPASAKNSVWNLMMNRKKDE